MKRTPHALIAFGVVCLLLLLVWPARGVAAEGLDNAVSRAAQLASERMSTAELIRVFEMPEGAPDSRALLEASMGRHWSRGMVTTPVFEMGILPFLGLVFVGWGIAEFRARRTCPD